MRLNSAATVFAPILCLSSCASCPDSSSISVGLDPVTKQIKFGYEIKFQSAAECALAAEIKRCSDTFQSFVKGCPPPPDGDKCLDSANKWYKKMLNLLTAKLVALKGSKGAEEDRILLEAKAIADTYVKNPGGGE